MMVDGWIKRPSDARYDEARKRQKEEADRRARFERGAYASSEDDSRAALRAARKKGWTPDALLPKLLDRCADRRVSWARLGLLLQRAAERLIQRGVLVRRKGMVSMDADAALDWRQRRNLLELFLRKPTQQPEAAGDADTQYVTLDQMAALARRTKRTLEGYKTNGMPSPDIKGGGGKPSEWIWRKVRPWLEQQFGGKFPEIYPSVR